MKVMRCGCYGMVVGGWRGRDDGGCKESGRVKCEGEQKEDIMKML